MAIHIELPTELEHNLRQAACDLDQIAKEALLVELYRQDKLTHYELSLALDLDRFETDEVLKRHQVTEDLPTPQELAEDLKVLTQIARK